MTLHTYTPQPMSLPSINFLHLIVSEKQPGQTFPFDRLPAHPDTMGENDTLTAIKGCGVKTLRQLLHKGNKSGSIPCLLMYRRLLLSPTVIKSESILCFMMYRMLLFLATLFIIVGEVFIIGEVYSIGEVLLLTKFTVLLLKFALLVKFTVSIH